MFGVLYCIYVTDKIQIWRNLILLNLWLFLFWNHFLEDSFQFQTCLETLEKINSQTISFKWYKAVPNDNLQRAEKLSTNALDVVIQFVWNVCRLSCTLSFKRVTLSVSEQSSYLRIKGKCKECDASLLGACFMKPNSGTGINISLTLADNRGIPHNKWRYVKDRRREHRFVAQWRCKRCEVWRTYASIHPS